MTHICKLVKQGSVPGMKSEYQAKKAPHCLRPSPALTMYPEQFLNTQAIVPTAPACEGSADLPVASFAGRFLME